VETVIQLAKEEDLTEYYESLLRIIKTTNGVNGFPYFSPRTDLPEPNEYLKKFRDSFLEDDDSKREQNLLLMKADRKIIGNLLLTKIPLETASHRRSINGISVEEEYRGRGLSKELLNYCIQFSKNIGVEYLDLGVFTENKNAIKLYEKFGFEQVALIEDEFRVNGKKLDSIQMCLKL
jgi:ribosomal protein S18 acetylase RimI-like enzyme